MNFEWSEWKKKFCETFANKGWNPVTYALSFRYKEGSLLDYAMRKEKLLIDMRRSIDQGTLIDLIVVGLPEFIINRIDREELKERVDLFNEIAKYEHMINKKNFYKKKLVNLENKEKTDEKKPCKICERLNKGIRYHSEATCWFKTKQDNKNKENHIRHVNNAIIEAELNYKDKKNE